MSKKSFIDAINVKSPCSEEWSEMTGNDQVRFCSHCAKSVNNLSEMTRKEAIRLVRRSGGSLCIRYVKDTRTNSPLFASTLHQIARRSGIAAGVLGTSLLLSAAAHSQAETTDPPTVQIEQKIKIDGVDSSISGYVTDPNGAAIPFALVSLINQETSEYKTVNASDAGFYKFEELNEGKYTIKFEAGGFEAKEMQSVYLGDASQIQRDAQLAIPQVAEVLQVNENSETFVTVGLTVGILLETRNALVQAVLSEDLENVKARVMMRARINVKDKAYGSITPLHAAVETGNIEIVQFLLSHGAKPNIRDARKRTPLMMLDDDATPELFQLLLSYGAKPNLVDKAGNNLLHHFAEFDRPEIMRMMTEYGLSINAANKEGTTALMIAAENRNADTVRVLLESGADVNRLNGQNESAWDLASSDIQPLLETFGATARNK